MGIFLKFIDWLNSISGLGMLILTFFYVLYTQRILQANQEVVRQTELTRLENKKPDVIAYFDVEDVNILNLHVKNIGATPAINTRVYLKNIENVIEEKYLQSYIVTNTPISTLAPNQELKTFCGMLFEVIDQETGNYPIIETEITYQDLDGRSYTTLLTLDINMFKGLIQTRKNTLHELTKEIEKLRREIEKIRKKIESNKNTYKEEV